MVRNIIQRATSKYRTDGIMSLLHASFRHIYINTIRPHLPPTNGYPRVQGVIIPSKEHQVRIFDDVVPWIDISNVGFAEGHKKENVDVVNRYVSEGDEVVVIGGGYGVTAVTAANQCGHEGSVLAFEGSRQQANLLSDVIESNGVENIVKVVPEIVGEAIDLKGNPNECETVPVSRLPTCDVLEMDCEGAEKKILSDIEIHPRIIIVETHPRKGARSKNIRKILTNMNYEIVDSKPDRHAGDVLVGKYNR